MAGFLAQAFRGGLRAGRALAPRVRAAEDGGRKADAGRPRAGPSRGARTALPPSPG